MENMLKNNHSIEKRGKKNVLQKTKIILITVFLLLSFLFISPAVQKARSTYHSSQLTKQYTRDQNSERTEYTDSKGRLTIAADLGYAVMAVTKTESGRLEKYYDDQGEPISRSDGYYAVLRQYNEKGDNIRNTYLDNEYNPIMTHSGYAIQEREYNDNNRVVTVRYLDTEGNPVCTASYGYGRIYEYDENGNNSKQTYCDASGKPMITKLGYASVTRKYYVDEGPENGKVESEFYFDEEGASKPLSLGQYGVHIEYNELGQKAKITYLDATGNPMITNKGYTTVERTFHVNNYVATEKYYDLDGKPFSLPEGQYGIKQIDGQTDYLDQNGKEIFNLKNLLYNHSWTVILLSIAVIVMSVMLSRRWNVILVWLCVFVIVYLTLMFRETEGTKNTELFGYYRRLFESSEARADIIKNIWLFIPLGAVLYQLCPKKRIILAAVGLSILIEIIQYITGTGYCELDDIISNSLGGTIGFIAGKLTTDLKRRINRRRHS